VPVQWKTEADQVFEAHLEISGKDRTGLLSDVSDVFSQTHINIERGTIVTLRDQVRNRFRVHVKDLLQLEEAMERLKLIPGVTTVIRRRAGG